MKKWYFCKQCGYSCVISGLTKISNRLAGFGNPKICPNCNIEIIEIPDEIASKYDCFNGLNLYSSDWIDSRQVYIEEYVSKFPEFQSESYQKELIRLKESAERHFQYEDEQKEIYISKINKQTQKILDQQNCVPKCPICGSSNVSKIGVVNRAVSTGLFGLASSKIGKTHKCNNCGATW